MDLCCKEGKRRAAASRTVHRCAGDHVDVWGEGLACEPRGSPPRSRIQGSARASRARRVPRAFGVPARCVMRGRTKTWIT